MNEIFPLGKRIYQKHVPKWDNRRLSEDLDRAYARIDQLIDANEFMQSAFDRSLQLMEQMAQASREDADNLQLLTTLVRELSQHVRRHEAVINRSVR